MSLSHSLYFQCKKPRLYKKKSTPKITSHEKTIKQKPHSPSNSIKIETPFNFPSKDIFPYTYIYIFHSQGSWSWSNKLTILLAISIYQHLITTIMEIRSTVNKHWPHLNFMLRGNNQGSVTHARNVLKTSA